MAPNTPSLVVILSMSAASVVVLILRLASRRLQRSKMDIGDWLAVLDILVWGCFLGVVPGVLIWGTNNLTAEVREALVPGSEEVANREMGSKFLLVHRVMYISVLWVAKGIVWSFYHDLITRAYNRVVLMWCYGVLLLTYIIPVVVTLTECKPFELYWTVTPNPGSCVRGLTQLWTVGTLNIGTDILLMGLLVPVLHQVQLPWYKKAGLCFLFCIGTFLIVVTAVRITMTVSQSHSQAVRTLWGTAEMLAATCVANAPALYASARKCVCSSRAKRQPPPADVERGGLPAISRPSRTWNGWSMAWSSKPSTWRESKALTWVTGTTITVEREVTVSRAMVEPVLDTGIHAKWIGTNGPGGETRTGAEVGAVMV
ncbi:hypothetical protein B0T14DRAFT_507991 [Immersiella caudata]|uniref:Rhodopsin domain-containing protein n=1 Tax=Immersiella caudata TaxID=314043 RepID=A0AA40CDY8_9PEZI|nr:hypothetical protein B0T14DRAFT_507991 [Immersiella caudata]